MFRHSLRTLSVYALSLHVFASGCGDDARKPAEPVGIGEPDIAANQSIRVDEGGMVGVPRPGVLAVQIPTSNLTSQTAKGTLRLVLAAVGGSMPLTQLDVPYEIGPNQTQSLAAEVTLPADILESADWVKYNLKVMGAGDLRITRSLFAMVAGQDVRLEGPATVTRNRKVAYRVRVQDPVAYRARAGVPVELQLRRGATVVQTLTATTSDLGDAIFEVTLPDLGDYEVHARTLNLVTTSATSGMAKVESSGARVLLTTDKPIYQPGQTIHLRALALSRAQNTAVAAQPVTFEVADGKGNKVFKKDLTTDAHGIASGTFKLGRFVNMGAFKVTAAVGQARTEKSVQVSRYVLPKFRVAVKSDRGFYMPGETITGSIDAQYFFGKAVAGGDVSIEAASLDVGETVFAKVMGKTNATGVFSYSLPLPSSLVGLPLDQGNALVNLRVKITDTAGQDVIQEKPITVAAEPLRVAIVPESNVLVPGVPNTLEMFVTDPMGGPIADAILKVSIASEGNKTAVTLLEAQTDAFGQAQATLTPPKESGTLVASYTATTAGGISARSQLSLPTQTGGSHLLVRTDRSVYAVGDTVKVDLIATDVAGSAYVNVINRGQTVNMRTLPLANGAASFELPITTDLLGDSRIEAYVVDATGNIVRTGRTVFARGGGGLTVELATDQPQYLPGTPAKLTFSVKDELGAPTVAALGVQVVDEAVFSVIDARPGLLRTFFELEESFAKPTYQLRPPVGDLNSLLFTETAGPQSPAVLAAQRRARATFAALGDKGMMGIQAGSWEAVYPALKQRLIAPLEVQRLALRPILSKLVKESIARLKDDGCELQQYYCDARRSTVFAEIQKDLVKYVQSVDLWGNLYSVNNSNGQGLIAMASVGPDELPKTKDDLELVFTQQDLDLTIIFGAGGADAGAFFLPVPESDNAVPLAGNPAGSGGSSGNNSQGSGDDSPRVRKDFPETLYVNPALITGADGKATVTVDMADSITEWRVSSLAHSPSGKLGGGVSGIKVFQEFFVDVNFPATLTRGDEISFPVAVYNYLPTPQTVKVSLIAATWYTALGAKTLEVALAPGEVKGIRFPVRVNTVGRQTLTVTGVGSSRSDAVARNVLIQPDGKAMPLAQSGSLSAGQTKHNVTFPSDAVPGSQQIYVNIFPAFLSSVVQGMDSILQVPNGCFEQTTATAWPNVLVTDYLKKTGQITPETGLKAESLMSAGYQRLLTFEHPGGGFSWFGTQDGHPFLSVTAFGLMEFSDMAKVHTVDAAMVTRTRDWLVAQQMADGSWKGDQSEFFSFHTSSVRNTAFVVWALAAAGYTGQAAQKGLAYVKQNMNMQEADGYTLGILANAFVAAAPNDPTTTALLTQLEAKKTAKGDSFVWDSGGTQTSFYGNGNEAKITATALAAHAFLAANSYKSTVDGALKFLTANRDSLGNFGSTQATIWTLRTLLLAASKGTDGAVGTVTVTVDGQPAQSLMLTPDQFDVMTTVDLASVPGVLAAGEHEVALTFSGTGKLSYNLVSNHHVPWKEEPPAAGPLSISVNYDKTQLVLNDTVKAKVAIKNNTKNMQNMVLVTVGLIPGFAVLTEDLDALRAAKKLSMYEITGKQVILYVTELAATSTLPIEYRLRATMPVRAGDGGAEVALYYEPAQKANAPATILEVTAD